LLALVLDMTVIPDTNSSPTLAERWIKANIAAAIVAGLASLAVYAVKQGASAADAQAGSGALFILYLAAVVFSGLSGAAGGVLTGAVLQRIVRRLPARTWIVLHAAMSSGAGLAVEMMDAARGDRTSEAVALDPGLLPSSIFFGALMGALAGGLEALVLRPVATGLGVWIRWSAIAYAGAWLLLVTGATLLQPGGSLSGELINQALSFAAALIVALLTLPALAALAPHGQS
jgi:hypothetical protein